ncbi:uncharacterized protein LOC126655853 isoform X2 [Mercurialis annua]|nr:uncharacterized protein LOC126655853 isoform X2 [Mercurialis annua]XP_050206148.1 uncharacterized protein LOC126655853 isoform X2 [Mercurialis annua]XP_055959565.1 uncharacterized protein LOC126655853 isoform X2 [Mercurialis annua]
MHVGGSVWGLDWCPRDQERSAGHVNCEFVAVAAHPPDSCYHEIGVPVAGRGVVQIWCILNVSGDDEKTSVQLQRSKQVAKKSNDKSIIVKRPQGRPRKTQLEENSDGKATNQNCTQIKRPIGRPRKKPIEETLNDETTQDNSTQFKKPRGRPRKKANDESLQALAVQYPEDSSQVLAIEPVSKNTEEHMVLKNKGNKRKSATKALSASISTHETTKKCRRLKSKATVQYSEDGCQFLAIEGVCEFNQEQALQKHKGKKQKGFSKALSACSLTVKPVGQIKGGKSKAKAGGNCSGFSCPPLLARSEDDQSFSINHRIQENTSKDVAVLDCGLDNVSGVINSDSCIIPADVALPRVLLCLAHDGKVVWDVKWRPCYGSDSKRKHRMGYLAVLLGNGFLEVWDVPLPHVTKVIYSSSHREGTDPRFVKLEPVFKGLISNHGHMQSVPLTVEWSTSYPHDYLLVGCHDGTVALWKFSASGTSGDTRPFLCFSADTAAIRAVAWAPYGSDQESGNIILTGGHGGLKFWDLRDPFRPLWDLHPAPRFIYSLDWLPDPRGIILSFDDGTMRLLGLAKAANDAHIQLSLEPKQPGMHNISNFSSHAIWSVQVSRKTGLVAYCSADGTVCRFQLATKSVEKVKDPSRNRTPHFMIGFMSKDKAAITVNSPSPDIPLNFKKPVVGNKQRSMKDLAKSCQEKKRIRLLAISDGNDDQTQCELDETLGALRSRNKEKSKNVSKKTTGEISALVCIDENRDDRLRKETGKGEAVSEVEVMPPKIIAMHRVRWNMNKGSERWLCSGGAAGIVRCQKIMLSDTDKFLARKWKANKIL